MVCIMTQTDEKWLDERYLAELDYHRTLYDLDGWLEVPVMTFAGRNQAGWLDGEVTDSDRSLAAAIRERVRGRQHSRGQKS